MEEPKEGEVINCLANLTLTVSWKQYMKVSVEVIHSDLTRQCDCCEGCEVKICLIILIGDFY
jgi:hypothetical protein